MSMSIKISGLSAPAEPKPKELTPEETLSQYPPPPPIAVFPSVDQDLYAYFNLYPHVIAGKFYRKGDKPLRIDIKKQVEDVPGVVIEPTLDKYGVNTGVIQDDNSKLLRLGPQGRPIIYDPAPSFTSERVSHALKDTVLRFREHGPPLELLPRGKRK